MMTTDHLSLSGNARGHFRRSNYRMHPRFSESHDSFPFALRHTVRRLAHMHVTKHA